MPTHLIAHTCSIMLSSFDKFMIRAYTSSASTFRNRAIPATSLNEDHASSNCRNGIKYEAVNASTRISRAAGTPGMEDGACFSDL